MKLQLMSGMMIWLAASMLPQVALGDDDRKSCENIYDQATAPYRSLFYKMYKGTKLDTNLDVVRIVGLKRELCQESKYHERFSAMVLKALSDHTARIGVLLPLSGPKARGGQSILKGIQSLYPYRGIAFNQRVIVKDTRGVLPGLEAGLGELVFKHRVGVVIGGFTRGNANALAQYASQLQVPTVIVNAKVDKVVAPNVFHVFPEEDNLAARLADHARMRGFRRVAILHPLQSRGRRFSSLVKEAMTKQGIDTSHTYSYNPDDYYSIMTAAERVFKIDRAERSGEFQTLMYAAKRRAQRAGVGFNPSMVALPPIVEVDAVLIDDNFRNVRHLAKIFKFLGVDKINLLGTPQWRARGLIEPEEPFLAGAVFADYVGSYNRLPKGVVAATFGSPYFVDPSVSSEVDYEIIGNQAALAADKALSQPVMKRRQLHSRFATLTNDPSPYFASGEIFDNQHRAHWPSFLFQVGSGSIQPLHSGPVRRQAIKETVTAQPTKKQ